MDQRQEESAWRDGERDSQRERERGRRNRQAVGVDGRGRGSTESVHSASHSLTQTNNFHFPPGHINPSLACRGRLGE